MGIFYADDVQLEESETPSNYNLLENGDMQTAGYAWTMRDATSFVSGAGVNSAASEARSIKIVGTPEDETALAYQVVNINESGAQTYVLSGWAKADAVTDNVLTRSDPAYDHSKQFGLRANLTYSDGTTTQTTTYDSVGNVASTTLKSAKNSGSKVITSSSVYTDGGNRILSATDSAGGTTSYEYASGLHKVYNIPSKITDAKGGETSYAIDAFGRYQDITVDNGAGLSYIYSNSRLHRIRRMENGAVDLYYQFSYDPFDNMTSLAVGNRTLMSYTYAPGNGLLTRQTYGNGNYVSYTYDALGRAKTTTFSDGRVLTYRYTGDGQLFSTHDSKTGLTYQYGYDELGRLVASSVKDSSGVLLNAQQTYDANDQLTGQSWQMDGTTYAQTFTYNKVTGDLTTVSMPTGETLSYAYDDLQRLSVLSAGDLFTRTYHYRNRSNTQTTTQVSGVYYLSENSEDCFDYEYDSLGNIISYTTSTGETTYYTYDSLGQLIEAENSYRFAYTYDKGGNILTASRNDETHTYTYGDANWADLLTAYDGQSITYDGSGNPLSYYNGTRYTFTWEEGRRLTSAVKNGSTYTYAYDLNGIRTSKVVDGVTHTYLYASGKLLRETYGNTVLDFFYDATGVPYAMNYTVGDTTTTYYYITNLQGDVIYMVDSNYNTAAYYIYDPYGKVLSASGSMGQINPLRYRGYYYDSETGFYYLQSRYYDPSICRFINADDASLLGVNGDLASYNLFAYCGNNPVNMIDSAGTWPKWLDRFCEGAKDTWEDICDGASAAWDATTEWCADAWDATTEWCADAWDATTEWSTDMIAGIVDSDLFDAIRAGGKVVAGVINIVVGGGYILAPIPTPADDLIGVRKITQGIIQVSWGIGSLIGEVIE